MSTFGKHRILSGILVINLMSALGVHAATTHVDMNLKIQFKAIYDGYGEGTLLFYLYWNISPKDMIFFELYADGKWANACTPGSYGFGWALHNMYAGRSAFQAAVDKYLSGSHVYRMEMVAKKGGTWYDGPDVLQIENRVAGFSDKEYSPLLIHHMVNAIEGFEDYDVTYSSRGQTRSADAFSFVRTTQPEDERKLQVDCRPKGSTSDVDLWLQLATVSGGPIDFPSATDNELQFSIPTKAQGYEFGSQPITIQQYDPSNHDVTYPRWDVRKLIEKNGGVMPLADLQGSYGSEVPYAFFTLSFSPRTWGDFNADGAADLRDFAAFAKGWRTMNAPSVADLAGHGTVGWPDGKVDGHDLLAFCENWVAITQWLPEGFESGSFKAVPWSHSGNTNWRITNSSCHSGSYCAQAGQLGDHQTSILTVKLTCAEGQIRFWRKVSSQSEKDFLRFRIGDALQAEWSGELDWEQVSFPVQAGVQIFTWSYVKDYWDSHGQDTAWIDDITFPPR